MLCRSCEASVRVLVRRLEARSNKSEVREDLVYPSHDSLLSLYESIAVGCFICRYLWAEIITEQLKCVEDVALCPHVLRGSVPETYEQFQEQILLNVEIIGHLKRGDNVRPYTGILTPEVVRNCLATDAATLPRRHPRSIRLRSSRQCKIHKTSLSQYVSVLGSTTLGE